ncbi:unnamed protein product [Dicrocoelium dendriticum]|nr:unnamed protein product [Dicrocoelium dendriticum]
METLAAVNQYLSYNVLKCNTRTGQNWDLEKDDEAQPFKVMAEVSMTGNQSAAKYCEYLICCSSQSS